MAKVQKRRGVSLNREIWALVKKAAERRGESAAQYVTMALRTRLQRDGMRLPKVQWFTGPVKPDDGRRRVD